MSLEEIYQKLKNPSSNKETVSEDVKVSLWKNKFVFLSFGWNMSYLRIDENMNWEYKYCRPYSRTDFSIASDFSLETIKQSELKEFYNYLKNCGFNVSSIEKKLQSSRKSLEKCMSKFAEIQDEKLTLQDQNKITSYSGY